MRITLVGTMMTGNDIHSIRPHVMRIRVDERSVIESPRQTPVAAHVDVVVAGGGPAGVAAALAAARFGAKTLVIERQGMLGGVWTAGLLNPLFDPDGKGWLVAELVERLKGSNAWCQWKPWAATFDTEAMKRLLEQMAADAGLQVWYYTQVADAVVDEGVVRGLVVEGKSGREAILAKVVVDCTGDGDVAARAGASYRLGRSEDGLCQPMTLMFEIEGVSPSYTQDSTHELYDKMMTAIVEHALDVPLPFERVNYTPWVIDLPRPGAAVLQATHIYRMNALNTRDVSAATIEGRRQVENLMRVLIRVPGLENIRLTQTAPAIGVREGRRICGRYTLDIDDLKTGRQFDDAVTVGRFPVDIHEVDPQTKLRSAHGMLTRPYEIPYRCLLPEKLRGLLVAGRCISGTHEAHASYRVTGTCMGMGQAAGLAAAVCAQREMMPDQVDGQELHESLAARGVAFLDRSAAGGGNPLGAAKG